MSDDNGWDEHKKLVLHELQCLKESTKEITNAVVGIQITLEGLKTAFRIKSGIWGIIGGCVPIALALAAYFVREALK